jgi:hypothetical protein
VSTPRNHRPHRWLISWPLRLVTAALLGVDAYVHADLIARYDPNQGTAALSQGDLFRIEALVASLAALALLVTARRLVWVVAGLVAASALGGLLLYGHYDPGTLGPLPDMYEPFWYPEKTLAATAEGAALLTSVLGLLLHLGTGTQRDERGSTEDPEQTALGVTGRRTR